MTTAAGKSAGSEPTTLINACSPPADAPMATMSNAALRFAREAPPRARWLIACLQPRK